MPITLAHEGAVTTLTLDDGKVNAMDRAFFDELGSALDEVSPGSAVVVTGREGMFSAGLNTKELATLDDDGLVDLLVVFGRTMLRVWLEPRPVTVAATGHAVAGGTILAMAADHAVAAAGDFKWGLSETTIGFPLPEWAIAIARGNVPADRLDDLLLAGTLVTPDAAVAAGFADVLVPAADTVDAARRRAEELAALPGTAYAETKRRLRGPAADRALARIEEEVRALARDKQALVLAHNYQRPEVQDVAHFVGDSLGLAIQAQKDPRPPFQDHDPLIMEVVLKRRLAARRDLEVTDGKVTRPILRPNDNVAAASCAGSASVVGFFLYPFPFEFAVLADLPVDCAHAGSLVT